MSIEWQGGVAMVPRDWHDHAVQKLKELEARHARLRKAAIQARELIKAVEEFRTEEGERPLGTIDYYSIEDLLKDLEAALAEEGE